MSLLGEGSETTEPYNKYDKIRPHSIRSLQFDQKVRPLSFRPETFDLFTATHYRTVLKYLKKIVEAEKTLGLKIEPTKCEIFLGIITEKRCHQGTAKTGARKIEKYRELLDNGYNFQPVALENQGFLGESSEISITRLCKMLCRSTITELAAF